MNISRIVRNLIIFGIIILMPGLVLLRNFNDITHSWSNTTRTVSFGTCSTNVVIATELPRPAYNADHWGINILTELSDSVPVILYLNSESVEYYIKGKTNYIYLYKYEPKFSNLPLGAVLVDMKMTIDKSSPNGTVEATFQMSRKQKTFQIFAMFSLLVAGGICAGVLVYKWFPNKLPNKVK